MGIRKKILDMLWDENISDDFDGVVTAIKVRESPFESHCSQFVPFTFRHSLKENDWVD